MTKGPQNRKRWDRQTERELVSRALSVPSVGMWRKQDASTMKLKAFFFLINGSDTRQAI